MKISLTGANGFIGKNLLTKLLKDNHKVSILSNKPCSNKLVKVFSGNLSSGDSVIYDFLKDSDVVINCAGEVSNNKKMQSTNVDGVKKILNIIRDNNMKIKLLQLGSAGVYQKELDLINYQHINESYEIYSDNTYEKSKLDADKEIIKFSENNELDFVILRPTAVYSKNMPNDSLRSLIKYVKKRYFFYIGSKDSILSYLHLEDLTDTMINIINHDYFNNKIYNLSDDVKLNQTIDKITALDNNKVINKNVSKRLYKFLVLILPKFLNIPIKQSIYNALTSRTIIDSSLAKKELQFKPTRHLHECIDELMS